jgi:hypothetical protein
MNYIYQLNQRGNYFKMIVTSRTEGETEEKYLGMYDFPIKQCFARGIYINTDGIITQRGLVFLCAFPGKTLNIMEMTTTINPDGESTEVPMENTTTIDRNGESTEVPNEFYFNGEQLSFNMFFETILMNTGL